MSGNFKIGAGIALDGEAEFKRAVTGINKDLSVLGSEMGKVTASFQGNEKSISALTAKSGVYTRQITEQSAKIDTLKTALDNAKQQYGENSNKVKDWQIQLNKAEGELSKLESGLKGTESAIKNYSNEQIAAARNSDEFKASQERLRKVLDITKIALAAVAFAIVGFTKQALEGADEIQALADKTGMSAERLQELKYAGDNLGVSLETITGAQSKLTRAMSSARDGSKAQAGAFAELGISVTDSNGNLRDSKEVMEEALTALGSMKNETERDAVAMKLFGKSAMELNPLIKAGGDGLAALSEEARKNGAVMSTEAIAGLDAFGDSMENVKSALVGKFGEAFAKITPQLSEFAAKIAAVDVTPLVDGLGFIIDNFGKIKIAVGTGVAIFALYKGALIAATVAQEAHNIVLVASALANGGLATASTALTAATGSKTAATILATNAAGINKIMTAGAAIATGAHTAAVVASAAATKVATVAQTAMNLAMKASPFILIAGGLMLIITHWKEITKAIKDAWNWLTKWNDEGVNENVNKKDYQTGKYYGVSRAGLGYATGTTAASSGWHLVGENGPELMNFRGGETVLNAVNSLRAMRESSNSFAQPSSNAQMAESPRSYTLNINTQIDGRTVARKIYEFTEELGGLRGVNLVEG